MEMMVDEIKVTHSEVDGHGEFAISNDLEKMGVLQYKRLSPSLVSANRTKVEPEFGGRGIAKQLFDALVSWASDNDQKIQAECSFVVKMFDRNRDLAEKLRA